MSSVIRHRSSLIRLDVFRSLFASVADEMGTTLGRASSSVNIKERRDYSCAIFDGAGRMIAQAAHIPVHLGSMPLSVEAAIRAVRLAAMDVADVVDEQVSPEELSWLLARPRVLPSDALDAAGIRLDGAARAAAAIRELVPAVAESPGVGSGTAV